MSPELKERLRTPILTFLALQFLLGINVLLGIFFIGSGTGSSRCSSPPTMVAIVILFAMEAIEGSAAHPAVRGDGVLLGRRSCSR